MGEVVFVAAILLLLIGAMGFYFYSRMVYTEKKINLLETILLDIKMMMEMEEAQPLIPPPKQHVVIGAPVMVQPAEVEEIKTEEEAIYAGVIDSVASKEASTVDYEALNRDELMALAEKRSLRVTKRMNRQTILTVLRESDKNTSVPQEQVVDGADASTGGAALDGSEDIPGEAI
jgi:hypothetical protein